MFPFNILFNYTENCEYEQKLCPSGKVLSFVSTQGRVEIEELCSQDEQPETRGRFYYNAVCSPRQACNIPLLPNEKHLKTNSN